jgi:hypothetical protein
VPGGIGQLVPQLMHPGLQRLDHVQGGGDLQLPGRRQADGRGRPQLGQARPGAQRALAQGRGALVEQHRVDPLHPGRVPSPQIVIGLQQRPAFQDAAGRDPAFRQPALGQQQPQVPAVGLVSLGVPLAAAGERGVRRLGQMRRDPGRGQLLRDIPPPGAPLDRERGILPVSEPRQPRPQVLPVRQAYLATAYLPGHGIQIVEGDLLPANNQPAYDRHRDLLTLRRGARTPPCELPTRSILTRA